MVLYKSSVGITGALKMGTKLVQEAYVDKASGESSFHQCSGMEKK